jgi:flagellar hook protein FlgE
MKPMVGTIGSAVSALTANTQRVAVSASNVANANTTGFKASYVALNSTTLSSGGGVSSKVMQSIDRSGFYRQTGTPTNLSIRGDGFFAVDNPGSDSGEVLFTRAGDFTADERGYLTNSSGLRLQGFPVGETNTDPSNLEPVRIAARAGAGAATSNVNVSINLDADEPVGGSGPDYTRTVTVYDSLGAEQEINLEFTRTSIAPNEFALDIRDENGTRLSPTETLSFDGDGDLTSSGSIDLQNIDFGNGSNPQDITLNIGGISQQSGGYSTISVTQDGAGTGRLSGVSIGDDSVVRAQFTNGESQALYRVPVATFSNPNGLTAENGSAFSGSVESGAANFRFAGEGGAGTLQASTLEGANVDLSREFIEQILSRISFTAALKTIETQNAQYQGLLDIKA